MTDSSVYINNNRVESKRFSIKDGTGDSNGQSRWN